MLYTSLRKLTTASWMIITSISLIACHPSKKDTTMKDHHPDKKANALINETSPYLLQHAYNPVNWMPWGEEAIEKAKKENKLLIISVGYAACHWCHVMEHESFEDSTVAAIMNEFFVPIKVDREERPDIDQVYMDAVQLMTQRGGWPLNCIALPDGRPIFGGTYFPKEDWKNTLLKVRDFYTQSPEKAEEYAAKLQEGISLYELVETASDDTEFSTETLESTLTSWEKDFDYQYGGTNRAPKFPMPSNYNYLLRYAQTTDNPELKDYLRITLDRMSRGGLYDHVGGGFSRYSTDKLWKVPHFEKMLYDNAQLISLYSMAYKEYKNEEYKTIVDQSIEFVQRELMSDDYGFYSSLDADSEGEEGKFYVWKKEELQTILGSDYKWFSKLYHIDRKGLWEHGNYILFKDQSLASFAQKENMSLEELVDKNDKALDLLLEKRSERVRPPLDDKCLTSWNALMITGLCDAYGAFGDEEYLDLALKNANFIQRKLINPAGGLFRTHSKGISKINAYLDDYALVTEAYIALYSATFDEKWITEAKSLVDYTNEHFSNKETQMFYYTSDMDAALIHRKTELNDNVIPASNSIMAHNLFQLGHLYDNSIYKGRSQTMLANMQEYVEKHGSAYSNWAILYQKNVFPYYEVVIAGDDAKEKAKAFRAKAKGNYLLMGSEKESKLPLLELKYVTGSARIYVCIDKACKLPVDDVPSALKQMK